MAKLFPPIIEGIVPAFYDNDYGMIETIIPFSMNRAVSQAQVKGLAVKIKTVQSSNYLYTGKITDTLNYDLEDSCWVRVSISKKQVPQMKVGQFYKFQIAYIGPGDEVGYYSTVGVGKYTTHPTVEIEEMTSGQINSHIYKYMGHYSQENGDITETEYSYQFDIYDSDENIIYTTNEQLHNSSNDTELYESYDEFFYPSDFPLNKTYRIKYTVKTINNMEISSPRYRIMQKMTIDPEIEATLQASSDFDNGCITINLVGKKDDDGLEQPTTGAFLLTRASSNDNYTTWDEISRFKLAAQIPSMQLWQDFTIEQGRKYKYSLQQYNDNGLYSNRIYSNIVQGDFEDAFLYDGKQQLKIKYNPKVSSFKKDILETKVDTIGSKHPFILRNGSVNYKEFPVSGLISYLMDKDGLFSRQEDYTYVTNLTGENMAKERDFKMKVYDWLTNGESKLFRSPAEGNFIVRLMNVSLAPNDTLGRMLHTFSATAYEVAEYNYSNLSSFGFISLKDPEVAQLRFETISLDKHTYNDSGKIVYLYSAGVPINNHPMHTVRLTDLMPGDKLKIVFNDLNKTEQIIQIGATGSYYIDVGTSIQSISLCEGVQPRGSMTYSYYSIQSNVFDKISNVSITEVPGRQFIGEHDILKEIGYIKMGNQWIKNPKINILQIYTLQAQKRSIEKITKHNGQYFKDKDYKIPLEEDKDLFTLYEEGDWKQKQSGDIDDPSYKPYDRFNWNFSSKGYHDFANGTFFSKNNYEPCMSINGSEISVEDIRDFQVSKFGEIEELTCGNGCNVEISYQIRNIDYSIEDDPTYGVLSCKLQYEAALKALDDLLQKKEEITDLEDFITQEKQCRSNVESNYNSYIYALVLAQEEEKKAEGLDI